MSDLTTPEPAAPESAEFRLPPVAGANGPGLNELIAEAAPSFTPAERLLAETVGVDPTVVAFSTVADVAQRAGVSGPSVIRFAAKLGFDGFGSLRDHVRRSLTDQIGRASDRMRMPSTASSWETAHRHGLTAVASVLDTVPEAFLDEVVAATARARRVWITTGGHTRPVGLALAHGLLLARPGVAVLGGTRLEAAMSVQEATTDDVAVAIEFKRYERGVVDMTADLAARDVPVVAITDGPLSPLVPSATSWCEIAPHAIGPLDSLLAPLAIVELVASGVADVLRPTSVSRIDAIEDGWRSTETFVQTADA